jgi:hypothetical protein
MMPFPLFCRSAMQRGQHIRGWNHRPAAPFSQSTEKLSDAAARKEKVIQ